MPELPEVEATVTYLSERIQGLEIRHARVFWARTVHSTTPAKFERALAGARVCSLSRRGKLVCIELCVGKITSYLLVHLRMSGSLDVISSTNEIAKHDRVAIDFTNGKSLRFNDTRKFGRMYLTDSLANLPQRLGIEPLSDEFSVERLAALLSNKGGGIKALLLRQDLIAGLGNIYVDESLWQAGIHPTTPGRSVKAEKVAALHQAIREILTDAISHLGTDFGDGVVDGGMYAPRVYGRAGEPCLRCTTPIRRMVVGQRGTHVCPTCQTIRRIRSSRRK